MKNLQLSDQLSEREAAGAKDVTRRIITKVGPDFGRARLNGWDGKIATFGDSIPDDPVPIKVRARYLEGDVVYLGESLVKRDGLEKRDDFRVAKYRRDLGPVLADDGFAVVWRWQVKTLPARYCPAVHARRFGRIVSVRPEQLTELDAAEARREGFPLPGIQPAKLTVTDAGKSTTSDAQIMFVCPLVAMVAYWRGLHGSKWDPQTWVWRIEWKSITRAEAFEAEAERLAG